MIYYTADLHFGYEKILQAAHRPFSTIEEMDACLIENWNSVVSANDTVYVVGDMSYNHAQFPSQYLLELNGHKHLIRGNHDTGMDDQQRLFDYFESVSDFLEIEDRDIHITLCHYPIIYMQSGYMIHGHLHNTPKDIYQMLRQLPKVMNAGVDINHYQPVTLEELIKNNQVYYQDPNRGDMKCRYTDRKPEYAGNWKADFRPLPTKRSFEI